MTRGNQNRTPATDAIVAYMLVTATCTAATIQRDLGFSSATVSKVLGKLKKGELAHVAGYQKSTANRMREAVWKIGRGDSLPRPYVAPKPAEEIFIPRPKLGLWGLVWNTTTPAEPAERNTAP